MSSQEDEGRTIRDRIAAASRVLVVVARARNVSSRYYGGLGLGLYIARAIIYAHNGIIAVESEEGVGSTFTIMLPVA